MLVAGFLIGLSAVIYLITGKAYLFAIGLITIIGLGQKLYTGKVGLLIEGKGEAKWQEVIEILIWNFMGVGMVWLLSTGLSQVIVEKSTEIVALREEAVFRTFLGSIFCGILMWIATIGASRIGNKVVSSLLTIGCVMAFVLAGFPHSIADSFYFLAGNGRWDIWLMEVAGNAIGANLIGFLVKEQI